MRLWKTLLYMLRLWIPTTTLEPDEPPQLEHPDVVYINKFRTVRGRK